MNAWRGANACLKTCQRTVYTGRLLIATAYLETRQRQVSTGFILRLEVFVRCR